jgi:ribosomal protein L11 methylase PrmA
LRTLSPAAVAEFEVLEASGLLRELVEAGRLVSCERAAPDVLGHEGASAAAILEHERIPFISYPYEWTFSALKAAALLHLDLQLQALAKDLALSDATAYNVQFVGGRCLHIDPLSFRRYREGEIWEGYRQFCEQFLNPLLLQSLCGVPYQPWYRGALEGIPTPELAALLRFRSRLSINVFLHVTLHARLQRRSRAQPPTSTESLKEKAQSGLSRRRFEVMLRGLRDWIGGLKPAGIEGVWTDYSTARPYRDEETTAKHAVVAEFAAATKPAMLWDIGCNDGEYSLAALANGADLVIGFDSDHGALERGFAASQATGARFQPLYSDIANPAPSQGWRQSERRGLFERRSADAVLALGLIHHLAIGRNVPLDQVVEWLTGLAPQGLIEMIPKSDPKVQTLLALREDVFPDYNPAAFESALRQRAAIVSATPVTASGRVMYWFRR